ncbi:unnamed protein product [Rhizoctonia solani]|uniref:BTB domain-containing protein n=1 Tax=Rhizoctonia solani TaxID=456999 RepID=A0A8H3B9S4_9AGAM|nr:unnamed protein product [Rhizoctonia solani]
MAKKKSTALATGTGYVVSIDRASNIKSDGETSSAEISEPLVRHPEFYFDNTLIAIQVENTLFNVHKCQLAKSEVFSDMFKNMDAEDGEPGEGSSPDHPIVMKGITVSDFTALLKILYANHCPSHRPAAEAPLVVSAFRLANVLKFTELRAYLLPFVVTDLGDVDKIVFAREFDIKEWLAPAHIHLCEREEPLNTEEARKLDVDSVLIISRMREKHRNQGYELVEGEDYCGTCIGMNYHGNDFHCKICASSGGRYRCVGASTVRNKLQVDHTAIEAGVKKWVEDGCVAKD